MCEYKCIVCNDDLIKHILNPKTNFIKFECVKTHYGIFYLKNLYRYEYVVNPFTKDYANNASEHNYIHFNKILEELRNIIFK